MTKKQVHQDAITTEDATIRTKMPDNDEDSEGTWNEDWDEKENFRFASEAVVVGASVAPAASEHERVLRLKAEARAYTLREETSDDRRRMKEQLPPPLVLAPPLVSVRKTTAGEFIGRFQIECPRRPNNNSNGRSRHVIGSNGINFVINRRRRSSIITANIIAAYNETW